MDIRKAILEKIRFPYGENESFSFDIKRDDLIDPIVSGNKWRKLSYNLFNAVEQQKMGLLTFGGAYSNHLIATARAAMLHKLQSIGIVRGEELNAESNRTLKMCAAYGMKLIFISRSEYQLKTDPYWIRKLALKYPEYFIVPEGGSNYYGMVGCQQILAETENNYAHVYLAGGTGTTAAGVLLGASDKTVVHVVSALKGAFLRTSIEDQLKKALNNQEVVSELMEQLNVIDNGHFGGFAKVPEDLLAFMNIVYSAIQLKLDPIYTGKAFYRMINDYKEGTIAPEDKVLFIHTGGLQGAYSWREKLDYL